MWKKRAFSLYNYYKLTCNTINNTSQTIKHTDNAKMKEIEANMMKSGVQKHTKYNTGRLEREIEER